MKFKTMLVHGHKYYDERSGLFKVPIHLTAIYEQFDWLTNSFRKSDRGYEQFYSRDENVTVRALERLLANIEHGVDALAFSSGMAAISTTYFSLLNSGDEVIISWECYYHTRELLQKLSKFKIRVKLVMPVSSDYIERITNKTKLVILETITNPTVKVLDVREVVKACLENNTYCIVDNTFATPVIYNPIKDGADLVIHSLTKYLAGHNDVLGGAIISKEKSLSDKLWLWRSMCGGIISPFDAFLVIRGINTLETRFKCECRNALEIAEYLSEHPKVEEVFYPGLKNSPYNSLANKLFKSRMYGAIVTFKVKGKSNDALKVLKSLRIIKQAPGFGGVESLIYYPDKYITGIPVNIRRKLGISENMLRLSVGLEDVEDLKEDLDRALKAI